MLQVEQREGDRSFCEEDFEMDLEEKQALIHSYLKKKAEGNAIVLKQAQTRNIIFLGRTRSGKVDVSLSTVIVLRFVSLVFSYLVKKKNHQTGKSTALRVLKEPFKFVDQISLFSITKHPCLYSFTVEYKNGEEVFNFNINIMDTPGLFEKRLDSQERNNEMIKDTISQCLEFEITKLHALFFVCSFESGIHQQDIDSILEMNRLFKGADKAFCLLVTRSETKMKKKRDALEQEIRSIPELKEFFSNPNVKIFFAGALNCDDFDNGAYDSVQRNLFNILALRTELYRHIFESQQECHVTDLELYREQKLSLSAMKAKVEELTKEVLSYQGSEEEKAKLKTQLAAETKKLKGVVAMVGRVTGQNVESETAGNSSMNELSNLVMAGAKAAGIDNEL